MQGKDLLSVADLNRADITALLEAAADMKTGSWSSMLEGRVLGILFEKPSLRTRVSFEMAIRQLGGQAIYLSPAEVGLGQRESAADVARVLSRYVDAVAIRTFSHDTLEEFAAAADIPVINALSDREHPCQALADMLTIQEHKGNLAGLALAYIGDGNNVAKSLLLAAAATGIEFRIASPPGYAIDDDVLAQGKTLAAESAASVLTFTSPEAAVNNADVIYTDVWASMGQEAEAAERRRVFSSYQLNEKLLGLAHDGAIVMHPLPAHRGEEVSETILDTPASVVFDQAENRLHVQKALLACLLGGLGIAPARYLE